MLEVRVDLLFMFQALQSLRGTHGGSNVMEIRRVGGLHTLRSLEARPAKAQGGDEREQHHLQVPVELDLALDCSTEELSIPLQCESQGVQLLHTPFITLSYG